MYSTTTSSKAGNDDCQPRSDWFLPLCTGAERLKDGAGHKLHPTQKPESLIGRIILAASNPGDVVLDPFTGSGTTTAAARKLGRSFIGIEREPAYVQAARERAAAVTPLRPGALPIAAPDAPPPRIAFAALIEAGLIQPGEILHDASGRHSATVLAGGAISANRGAGSIHKIGALVQNLPACNGWTFWHCERGGALTPIGTLRARLRERLAEAAE